MHFETVSENQVVHNHKQAFEEKLLSYSTRSKFQLDFESRRPKTWDGTFRGKGAQTGYLCTVKDRWEEELSS
jgi:hypothetical protein